MDFLTTFIYIAWCYLFSFFFVAFLVSNHFFINTKTEDSEEFGFKYKMIYAFLIMWIPIILFQGAIQNILDNSPIGNTILLAFIGIASFATFIQRIYVISKEPNEGDSSCI